jgi:hypothetical protein
MDVVSFTVFVWKQVSFYKYGVLVKIYLVDPEQTVVTLLSFVRCLLPFIIFGTHFLLMNFSLVSLSGN